MLLGGLALVAHGVLRRRKTAAAQVLGEERKF